MFKTLVWVFTRRFYSCTLYLSKILPFITDASPIMWKLHMFLKVSFTSLFIYCYCSVAQLRSTLCDPMDCSLTVSSVHGVSQAKILERVAIPFSRGSSWPSDWTCGFSTIELPGKPIYVNCIRRQKHSM